MVTSLAPAAKSPDYVKVANFPYYAYHDMFSELADLAAQTGTTFSVMVDDLTFSGQGATEALLNKARLILLRHGLQSKRRKEKSWQAGDAKSVTGVVLSRQGYRLPNLRRIRIHQLHGAVERSRTLAEKAKNVQRLAGALFSAGQIEPRFDEQGRALMRRSRADKPLWSEFCRLGVPSKQVGQRSQWSSRLITRLRQENHPGDIVSQLDELLAEGLAIPTAKDVVQAV